MKILQVVQSAYRTLVEEQDDTIIWLCENLHCAGADISVLLTGNASFYAVQSKTQPGVRIGDWVQTQPADITRDLANLAEFNVPVYVIQEELAERGLLEKPLLPGVHLMNRRDLPGLYDFFDQVWQW